MGIKTIQLENQSGLAVEIINIGARITRLMVGGTDVVLGFDTAEEYLPQNHLSDFGAVIGRYANRLAGGKICVDGHTIQLPLNNGPNCLHGGPRGWQYALFDVVSSSHSHVEMRLVSPDGDNGFPGTVTATVRYTLDGNALRIDYHAETDSPTVINMTNHSYFNLDGVMRPECGTILDHTLQIDADRFTPTDEVNIPLGQHISVDNTPFDFRTAKAIGSDIGADDGQLRVGHGYDHNYVLNNPGLSHPAAVLTSPLTDISLKLFTTAPGLQLYTGNFLDGGIGKYGSVYPRRSAVCLEAQQYPDSPNRHWPESTGRLLPGHPFDSTTIFQLEK